MGAFGAVVGCTLCGFVTGVVFICRDNGAAGFALLGAGFVSAGVSVFMFCGCKAATKSIVILTREIALWIKNRFVGKREEA